MTGEQNRKETLLAASKAGKFLETVYAISLTEQEENDDLTLDIAALHNEGLLDVVEAFKNLKIISSGGPDFFLTRDIFEKTLPHLNAPVKAVMNCVLQLHEDAGQDRAASTIFDSFVGFCAKDPSRPLEALKEIEAKPEELLDMLPATIAAGSQIDLPHYLAEVIRLSQHPNLQTRRRALFAMSKVRWPQAENVPDSAIASLELSAAKEHDDETLASVVKSAFALFQQDKATELRVTAIITKSLEKGGEFTLHSSSQIFGLSKTPLPSPLLDLLLAHLKRAKPENRETLNNVDYGIARLLKSEPAKSLRFLEDLLTVHAGQLRMKAFDSVCSKILKNNALLCKILTRWFLGGDPLLCESAHEICETHHGDDLRIEIDATELQPADLIHVLFVARKAIGYFFTKPITAASVVTSLIRLVPDDETRNALGQLLFDPLLLNYPGSVRDYIRTQTEQETGTANNTLQKALIALDEYLEVLGTVPKLPALHPSQAQRESYRRYMSDSTAKSMKAAERQSVFFGLFSKSTLLYGRTSINYVHALSAQPQRIETPLTSHSVEMEYPRMEHIDTFGLHLMLRRFRLERLRA